MKERRKRAETNSSRDHLTIDKETCFSRLELTRKNLERNDLSKFKMAGSARVLSALEMDF